MSSDTSVDLLPLLQTANRIAPDDVLELRRKVFSDGVVSKYEADSIIAVNDLTEFQCSEWHDFYVEALTDFLVNQAEPRGYVSEDNADWLVGSISRDGRIKGASELEFLVKTIERASQCPQTLVNYVLDQVVNIVISGEGELTHGKKLTRGVIGEAEAEILRRVLYGVSSGGGINISRREAEILFDLNDQTVEAQNHPAWNDLFVKAIANYLMVASGYQTPDRETAFARKEWLDDNDVNIGASLKKSFSSVSALFRRRGGDNDAFKSAHQLMEERWSKRNRQFEHEQQIAEQVDDSETQWLTERIGRDGTLHENEKALLLFLRENGADLHPSLQVLLEKEG